MSEDAVELVFGEKIPVIDFTGLKGADLALRKATAVSMREAFEDFGFIYLKNHTVPQIVIDELFARSIAFFDLPQAKKVEAGGYRGAGLSGLDPSKPTDVKERFRAPYDSNLAPGYWPERLPEFRQAIWIFHEAGLLVLRQVMRGVALSLGLPEEYFARRAKQARRLLSNGEFRVKTWIQNVLFLSSFYIAHKAVFVFDIIELQRRQVFRLAWFNFNGDQC
jgi:isopenicillin N synthase-like dioxygenase